MTADSFDHVREKDHAVLTAIHDGHDDTRAIGEVTTLSNQNINYSLDKLESLGLITTETPDGRVTRVVNGQKRNFKAPRQAQLTDTGIEYLATTDRDGTRYQDMTHEELVEQVHNLEQRIDDVEAAFDTFRQQVLRKLE